MAQEQGQTQVHAWGADFRNFENTPLNFANTPSIFQNFICILHIPSLPPEKKKLKSSEPSLSEKKKKKIWSATVAHCPSSEMDGCSQAGPDPYF